MDKIKANSLFDISKKVIVLTGGSGKLGSSYAGHLINQGSIVCNLDIEEPIKKSYTSSKNYKFLKTDLTNKEEIISSAKKLVKEFGNINALINNAALDSPPGNQALVNGKFETYPEEAWDKVMEVNLKSIFLCCQVFGSLMVDNNVSGSIINISSHYGVISPDQRIYNYREDEFNKPISYSTSKSGILNLTRYLSTYWGSKSIRVNTLTLGGVEDKQDKQFITNYSKKVPLGRMANEKEYFGALQFLIGSASSYMTGANLVLDGGWTAW